MVKNIALVEEIIELVKELPSNKERKELSKEIVAKLSELEQGELIKQITDLLLPLNRDGQITGIIDKVRLFGAPGPRNTIIKKVEWLSNDALQTKEETIEALEEIQTEIATRIEALKPKQPVVDEIVPAEAETQA